jgi:hypothetical protein
MCSILLQVSALYADLQTLRQISLEITNLQGKGKGHPITDHEVPEGEQMYSFTLPSTSALEGGRCSTPRPGRFTPWKETRYPLYRRLGGPQGRSGRETKLQGGCLNQLT